MRWYYRTYTQKTLRSLIFGFDSILGPLLPLRLELLDDCFFLTTQGIFLISIMNHTSTSEQTIFLWTYNLGGDWS